MNRTIISRARCMLSNAGLHRLFGLRPPPLLVISLTVHHLLLLIRKLQLRYGLVHLLIIHSWEFLVALLMLMLIMESWSLGLLSASFLVISLVLKVLNCGILKPRRSLLAKTLSLMNLLCYMMFHLLMFLLRVNNSLLFRWSQWRSQNFCGAWENYA